MQTILGGIYILSIQEAFLLILYYELAIASKQQIIFCLGPYCFQNSFAHHTVEFLHISKYYHYPCFPDDDTE